MAARAACLAAMAAAPGAVARAETNAAPLTADAWPLTERIVMVHVDDGYVRHHAKGQKRGQEQVIATPIDATAAAGTGVWAVASDEDPAFRDGLRPEKVGRKTKGTDFAWMVEGWDQRNNRAVNRSLDHATEHWFYLVLPRPMSAGKSYRVLARVPLLPSELPVRFDPDRVRSEAVHVNTVGYGTRIPARYGYVHHWMGDLGGLDLSWLDGRAFRLVDPASGATAFTGKVRFRARADQQETLVAGDTPGGNFLCAVVMECDFSSFGRPGRYVLAVDGVGCSFPFAIGSDVMREAFHAAAKGLYHNRSGIALTRPYTEFERPAPHNPQRTPGFQGKLMYTRLRSIDNGGEKYPGGAKALEKQLAGPLDDVWGWYQDAGDWDGYISHLNVPATLLFTYELAPRNFTDGELNIPESGNGVPDLLDEAAWLPRYGQRLRHSLMKRGWGTGGIGLRVSGDDFGGDGEGVPSYEDVNRTWVVYGEDPVSTVGYAGVCAHLAYCLRLAGRKDPEGVDWRQEAVEAFAWAQANTKPGDERLEDGELARWRAYAAAGLFRLTGEPAYEAQLDKDTAAMKPDAELWWRAAYGPWVLLLGGGIKAPTPALAARLMAPVRHTIERAAVETPNRRALRWGGNRWMPMLIGQQTTPWILEGMVGVALFRDTDPKMAAACAASVQTSCDYVLGNNALNMTWVTGLGPRRPRQVFHMDAWYNGKGDFHPGIVPYGPWRKGKDIGSGPWDADWPNPTLYPHVDRWPGNERWYDNRCAPLNSEFTVHQNSCYAVSVFGWLCAPAPEGERR